MSPPSLSMFPFHVFMIKFCVKFELYEIYHNVGQVKNSAHTWLVTKFRITVKKVAGIEHFQEKNKH